MYRDSLPSTRSSTRVCSLYLYAASLVRQWASVAVVLKYRGQENIARKQLRVTSVRLVPVFLRHTALSTLGQLKGGANVEEDIK